MIEDKMKKVKSSDPYMGDIVRFEGDDHYYYREFGGDNWEMETHCGCKFKLDGELSKELELAWEKYWDELDE